MELGGETLLNHYISVVGGDEANEKTCNAHSEGPRKCHGNWESKKKNTHTQTSQLDGNLEQFLFVFVRCLCVNL